MDDKILRLIELQEVSLALRALESERQQGPAHLATLEASFQETSATVGAVKHRHDALREGTASLETELKDLQARLARFQTQLMEVKNNREYSAVLKEIDQAKLEIAKRDEAILTSLQEMESLQNDLPEVEARLAAETEIFDRERAEIEKAMQSLERRGAELNAERRRVEAGLPRDIVASFYRVAEARHGVALAKVVDSLCLACNVRLRPQMYQEVRRGETLLTCDSCRRFLYYFEPPQEGGAPPAGGR